MYRTALAMEAAENIGGSGASRILRRRFGKALITDVRISKGDSQQIGKAEGRYITIEGEPYEHAVYMLLQKALEQMLPRKGVILAAGLGNPDITHDSLGARAARLIRCGGERRSIAVMETDVAANTGIETAKMVRAVTRELNAACVLAIDALACRDPLRIGRTVQISDTGIQPGSGVSAESAALTREFVGAPVIALGVPMVSELSGITGDKKHKGYLASPVDEDTLTAQWAEVIAEAVNGLFALK